MSPVMHLNESWHTHTNASRPPLHHHVSTHIAVRPITSEWVMKHTRTSHETCFTGLFAEYRLFYRAFLQKRPIFWRSLLIVVMKHVRVMTSFLWIAYSTHMCAMIHSYVCHDSFVCVPWFIYMCDKTHLYVCHDSFICVPCDSYESHTAHITECSHTSEYRVAKTHRIP